MKGLSVCLLGVLCACLLICCVNPEAAQEIIRGPYLQQLTEDGVIIRWRSSQSSGTEVRYGTSVNSLSQSATSKTSVTDHELVLTGLSANTRYYYAVGVPGSVPSTGDSRHTFETAPQPGTLKHTRIWVLGDSGTANSNAAAVRDRYKEYSSSRPADLLLMLGDNAYPDGTDSEYQDAVFDMYPEVLARTPVWPTLGNHDGHTATSSNQSGPYYDIFTLPRNAEAGGVPSGTEAYYSFDYANIHFVCLNSFDVDRDVDGAMAKWLESDLAANDKEWLIAFWHYPPYSKGSHDSDSEGSLRTMRENFLPILEDYDVDLVMSGHSHSYERSFLLHGHYGSSSTLTGSMILNGGDGSEDNHGAYSKSDGAGAPHEGAVYTVAGSSGKVSSASLDHPVMVISLEVLGSLIIDIDGGRMNVVFLDNNGAVRDEYTVLHGPDQDPPRISSTEAATETSVEVRFSERVDQASAETVLNYQIDNGINISSATLTDANTVKLMTTSHTVDVPYTLAVNNVEDLVGNIIAANSQGSYTYSDLRTLNIGVASGSDDAEENSSGSVDLENSDLELVEENSTQTVGIRFTNLTIPQGAAITNAYVQFTADETGFMATFLSSISNAIIPFQVDEVNSGATSLTIEGEDVDNATTFTTVNGSISSRQRTTAAISWSPVPWLTVGEAGPDQQTPNIASVIEELVNRPAWVSGNAVVIIITGTGERTAESANGDSAGAPLLHVEYTLGGNHQPTVIISTPVNGSTFHLGDTVSFSGGATDVEDGDGTASLVWMSDLDGSIGTGSSFSKSDLSVGVHNITATAMDNEGETGFNSTTITVFAANTPVLVGAGDIADCNDIGDEQTAELLETIPGTVFTLGDNAYPNGTEAEFNNCYEPTWGRHKARTRPATGNHDYDTPGASAYFNYFGAAAGDPAKGYYSYDVGDWHIIVLNSQCSKVGGCGSNSPQGQWLQADLAANPSTCTLAYWHHPVFSSSLPSTEGQDFWSLLYQAGADVILNGHAHVYERFAPQDPNGVADPVHGIREFVVGTGLGHGSFSGTAPNSEVQSDAPAGVLKLTLNATSYDWEFIPIAGETFTDSGSASCVERSSSNQAPSAI